MQRRVNANGDGALTVTVEFREEVKVVYDCGSDEEAVEDESTELVSSVTSSDDDFSIIYSDSDASSEVHPLYSDTMSLGEFNAAVSRLKRFVDKSDTNQDVSFTELYQAFDAGAKLDAFEKRARRGTAEFSIPEVMSSTRRMAALAFNRSTPEFKEAFLGQTFGDTVARACLYMAFFGNASKVRDIMDIRHHLNKHLQNLGDTIEAKNKERYEAVAKLPAYSTVIQKRRDEVEAMLDAGNQKEYRASLNM